MKPETKHQPADPARKTAHEPTLAKRVFLVEKSSDDIALTRRAILQAGYAVHLEALQTANALIEELNNQDAQLRLQSETQRQGQPQPGPDLFLIDTSLPELSAFKLVNNIRSNLATIHTPVVMISSGGEEDIFLSYKYGANSVIQKPVASTEYAQLLKDACRYWLNISVMPHFKYINKAVELLV